MEAVAGTNPVDHTSARNYTSCFFLHVETRARGCPYDKTFQPSML